MIDFCYPNGQGLAKQEFALEIYIKRTRIGLVLFVNKNKYPMYKDVIYLKSKKYIRDRTLVNFLKRITGINRVKLDYISGDI